MEVCVGVFVLCCSLYCVCCVMLMVDLVIVELQLLVFDVLIWFSVECVLGELVCFGVYVCGSGVGMLCLGDCVELMLDFGDV